MSTIYSDHIRRQMNEWFPQYIFYERAGRSPTAEYVCQCSRCRSEYIAAYSEICTEGFTLKHNDSAVCPKCKHLGTLFHKSRGKKSLTVRKAFIIWHKESYDSVTAYAIYASKAYNGDPWEPWLNSNYRPENWDPFPELNIDERAIYHFSPGDVSVEKWAYWGGWTETSTKASEPFGGGFGIRPTYTFINESVLQSTFLKYSSYKLYMDICEQLAYSHQWYINTPSLMRYICLYAQYPIMEMLMKTGLGRYVYEAAEYPRGGMHKRYFNWNAKRPTEFFKKLDPQQVKEVLNHDLPLERVIEYCNLIKAGLKLTVPQFSRVYHDFRNPLRFFELLKKPYGITYNKAINYISKQKNKADALTQWCDYIHDAEELNYDLAVHGVLYPKDLEAAHMQTINTLNAVRTEKEKHKMKGMTEKYKKRYAFAYGDYIIKVPESMTEIITEGKILSHCVGGYAERYSKGQCIILFLRRRSEADKPYFTIEVGGEWGKRQHIVQCHGYKNEAETTKPEAIKEFEKEFSSYLADPKGYKKRNQTQKIKAKSSGVKNEQRLASRAV